MNLKPISLASYLFVADDTPKNGSDVKAAGRSGDEGDPYSPHKIDAAKKHLSESDALLKKLVNKFGKL